MGYLNELQSAYKIIGDSIRDSSKFIPSRTKSIAGRAMDGTFQFACLMSDSIPIDSAATVCRTMERVYASFVQTVLSMNSTMDITDDPSVADYLRKFHTNVTSLESAKDEIAEKFGISYNKAGHFFEAVREGKAMAFTDEDHSMVVIFSESETLPLSVIKSNAKLIKESLNLVDLDPIPNTGNSPFYTEANDTPTNVELMNAFMASDNSNLDKDPRRDPKFSNAPQLLNPTDVKKANDLQPYALNAKIMAVNDKKEFVQFIDIVIGIKVIMHPIKSDEMISNIHRVFENSSVFFNFLRWTTGEKSFFKDLLFNINDTKTRIANRSSGESRWWNKLEVLRNTKSLQEKLYMKNQVIANTTMVLSQYEVDRIKSLYGYDLNHYAYAGKLCKALFLFTFIIVDEGTETIRVFFPERGREFETYSLDVLDRETSQNSNKLGREIARMVSR